MSTLKNIFKYIGILLGLCLGVVLIVLAGMIIFKFELFGYRYFKANLNNNDYVLVNNTNEKFGDKLDGLNMAQVLDKITHLTINSKNIDVYVRPYITGMTGDIINVGPYKIVPLVNAQGFAKFEENEKELVYNVDLLPIEGTDNLELVVDIKVPSGFASYGNSYLTVYTPFYADSVLNGYYANGSYTGSKTFSTAFGETNKENYTVLEKLTVNATSGDVTIFDATTDSSNEQYAGATIYAKNVDVTTTSGNQKYHRIGIENIKAVSDTGNITFSSLTNGTIPGNSTSKITITENNEETKTNLYLSSERGLIKFEKGIDIGKKDSTLSTNITELTDKTMCKIRGTLCKFELNSIINTNLQYVGNSDKITIGSALYSLLDIQSNNAHINIGSIYSNANISLTYNPNIDNNNKSGYRKIDIGYMECSEALILDTWSNDITIGTLRNFASSNKTSSITTKSGDIKIGNLIGNLTTESASGNITINQANIYTDEDANTLATQIANHEFGVILDSKKALLAEYQSLLIDANASSDISYKPSIDAKIDSIKNEIKTINASIESRKAELIADNTISEAGIGIHNQYNYIMRNNTNINVINISGAIKLENLVANKVTTEITENGTSSIKAQFKEINGKDSLIQTRGKGKIELFVPDNQLYFVYSKVNTTICYDGLCSDAIFEGDCRASIKVSDNDATNKTHQVTETNTIEKIMNDSNIHLLLTVENYDNGETILRKTSEYRY